MFFSTPRSDTCKTGISVKVKQLGGHELAKFQLDRITLVSAVRWLVHEASGIPACEQRLLCACSVLDDEQRLGDLVGFDTHEICLTLVRQAHHWSLSGDSDGVLQLWDLEKATSQREIRDSGPVQCMAVDWPARIAAVACARTSVVKVWDLDRGACLRELKSHACIRCIALNWQQRLALGGDETGVVMLWDLGTAKCIQEIHEHVGGVLRVSGDWQQKRGISAGNDGVLLLWDLETKMLLREIHTRMVLKDFVVDWLEQLAVSAGAGINGALWVWNLEEGTQCLELTGHNGLIQRIAIDCPSQRCLGAGTGSDASVCWWWDLQTGMCIEKIIHLFGPVQCLSLDAYRCCCLCTWTVGDEWIINLLDLNHTGKEPVQLMGHVANVTCTVLS